MTSAKIDQASFLEAARMAKEAVQRRNTIPVLSNLLIRAAGGEAEIVGTDLDIELTASAPSVVGDFETTVPADKLVAALGSFRPGALDVEIGDGKLVLKQGRSQRTLATLPASDFPRISEADSGTEFSIGAGVLARLFGAAHVAQNDDESRYYLNGVFVHAAPTENGHVLRAVATNGNILVRADAELPTGADELPGAIVASRAVGMLRRLLTKADEPVDVKISRTKLDMRVGAFRLVAKNVDGTFPDYTRVIPSPAPSHLAAARDVYIGAAQAVSAVVDGDSNKVRSIRVALGEEPEMSARDTLGSEAVEPVDGAFVGQPVTFGINSRYLQQVAGIFAESSKVAMHVADPGAPLLFIAEAEPDLLAVCMPMRV